VATGAGEGIRTLDPNLGNVQVLPEAEVLSSVRCALGTMFIISGPSNGATCGCVPRQPFVIVGRAEALLVELAPRVLGPGTGSPPIHPPSATTQVNLFIVQVISANYPNDLRLAAEPGGRSNLG
jgi:hypothetical protein